MGMSWFPFFGDKSNEELEKELTKVNSELAGLNEQRDALLKEIGKREGSKQG